MSDKKPVTPRCARRWKAIAQCACPGRDVESMRAGGGGRASPLAAARTQAEFIVAN